ncbi:MAG TPA: methyl-accepting chemotaxis protein [Candidatus Omnitrophota bacterium]|nr:methyl-accepting chemotaxis protein [Candidatus Omnitrophota bacterium]HQO38165.1 methyl-accepting chemotaxis protein [Candidatus Omnitrophota bacterium]
MAKLRNRFFVYFLGLSLIPLIITLVVLISSVSTNTRNIFVTHTQDLLVLQAEELADTIDRFLYERYSDLVDYGNLADIQNAFAYSIFEEAETCLKILKDKSDNYLELVLFDPRGRLLAGSQLNPTARLLVQAPSFKTAAAGNFAAYQAMEGRSPALYFLSPVRDTVAQQIIGVLAARINVAHIQQILTASMKGAHRDILILDALGAKILFSNIPDLQFGDISLLDISAGMFGAVSYQYDGKKIGGYSQEKGYKQYKGLSWKVVVGVVEKELAADILAFLIDLEKLMLLISIGIIVIVFFLAKAFTDRLVRPISTLTNYAKEISDTGDLTREVTVRSGDEIGVLAQAFNQMISNLREIVSEAGRASSRVNDLAQRLSSSTEELSASTEEISAALQQINAGITEQTEKTSATSEIMGTMVETVRMVYESARLGEEVTVKTHVLVEQGTGNSKRAVEKIAKINDAANDVKKLVVALGERSEKIGKILGVITEIAVQTNLLSLNAAIEAARAGDAGKGFAVVAAEVRKLAENSSKSAEEITRLIREIQKETTQAVASVQVATQEVSEGNLIIEDVRMALDEILRAADNSANQVKQIALAAQEQLDHTKAVSDSIVQIDSITNASAGASKDILGSVGEVVTNAQDLTSSAQELSTMAGNLQVLVNKFKVSDARATSKT